MIAFFQRSEGRRRRCLSLELPRRRRAAHRFLRALPRQTQFRVAHPAIAYGRLAEEAFARSVGRGGGQAVVRASFPPNDANAMLGPVRQVANAMKAGQVDALLLPAAPEDLQSLAPLLPRTA